VSTDNSPGNRPGHRLKCQAVLQVQAELLYLEFELEVIRGRANYRGIDGQT